MGDHFDLSKGIDMLKPLPNIFIMRRVLREIGQIADVEIKKQIDDGDPLSAYKFSLDCPHKLF